MPISDLNYCGKDTITFNQVDILEAIKLMMTPETPKSKNRPG